MEYAAHHVSVPQFSGGDGFLRDDCFWTALPGVMIRQESALLVFVYGTLKRGRALHQHLAGQRFAGDARTMPEYRLYRIEWYPGLVPAGPCESGVAIHGEVWDVDEAGLKVLDEVEEVDSGLYERRSIRLQSPFDQEEVVAYFFSGETEGCSDNGDCW